MRPGIAVASGLVIGATAGLAFLFVISGPDRGSPPGPTPPATNRNERATGAPPAPGRAESRTQSNTAAPSTSGASASRPAGGGPTGGAASVRGPASPAGASARGAVPTLPGFSAGASVPKTPSGPEDADNPFGKEPKLVRDGAVAGGISGFDDGVDLRHPISLAGPRAPGTPTGAAQPGPALAPAPGGLGAPR